MKSENKTSYVIGDFNMNCLKYHKNAKTKHLHNNIFEKGAISIINRPTRILEYSASLIDNILTTDISNNSLKKGITKSEVSDHFPIFFLIQLTKEKLRKGVMKIKKKFLITVTKVFSGNNCLYVIGDRLTWNCGRDK